MAQQAQLTEGNYKWHIPGGTLEVTYSYDNRMQKYGAKNVQINGQECVYRFKGAAELENDCNDIKIDGLLEIEYEDQTYILSYQAIHGKNHTIGWCLHLPKA